MIMIGNHALLGGGGGGGIPSFRLAKLMFDECSMMVLLLLLLLRLMASPKRVFQNPFTKLFHKTTILKYLQFLRS